MNHIEILERTADKLDEMIKLKGVLEWVDGPALKISLKQGFKAIKNWSDPVAQEFLETCQAFNETERDKMIDEGADLIAEIVKTLVKARFM